MGQIFSQSNNIVAVNYDCPVCQQSGKLPNIAGRFFIINDKECKCNGCNTIFEKSKFYKQVVFDAKEESDYNHTRITVETDDIQTRINPESIK